MMVCSGHRRLLEHERNCGLRMDALVIVHSRNTNGIMVWAWMLWSLWAFGTRTELWFEHWFAHGCSGHRTLSEHKRNYGLGMDAVVTVGVWNANGIMVRALVCAWMLWSSYTLGTQTELWFGHGCRGHRGRLERERNYGSSIGLRMDALVIVHSRNTNGIMVWAWMLWSLWAFGTRTELWFEHWFGHGCSGHRMLSEHKQNYGLGMDAVVTVGVL